MDMRNDKSAKKPLIILAGPTAVGKTALSVRLAKAVGGQIISADSMQVYRGMDIGTAKITEQEMDGVKHHLLNVLSPKEPFDVYRFCEMAKKALDAIYASGDLPIVVGGTGFYIQALLYQVDFTEKETDRRYREELSSYAETHGTQALHARLAEVDPQAAKEIHENNVKRVIRALEYYQETGERISEHNKRERAKEAAYRAAYFVLNDDRALLYDRIEKRIDLMLQDGLVQEVEALVQAGLTGEEVSMQGLGYKEILGYLRGEYSLEAAVEILKRDTRHYAKRQLTWFRRESDVIWLNRPEYESEEEILSTMLSRLKELGIVSD